MRSIVEGRPGKTITNRATSDACEARHLRRIASDPGDQVDETTLICGAHRRMRRVGIEPTCPGGQWLLRPSRIPVPQPPLASIVGVDPAIPGPPRLRGWRNK